MSQVTVKIAGKDYPLLLTVQGMKDVMELLGGGLDKLGEYLSGKTADGTINLPDSMDHTMAVLGVLIHGAEHNRRMEARFSDGDDTPHIIPDSDSLPSLILPGKIAECQIAILKAVNASMKQSVEVNPTKNVESGEHE